VIIFVCRDKRAKVDPKDYMVDGQNGATFYKLPGTINGQQFIIANCEVRQHTHTPLDGALSRRQLLIICKAFGISYGVTCE